MNIDDTCDSVSSFELLVDKEILSRLAWSTRLKLYRLTCQNFTVITFLRSSDVNCCPKAEAWSTSHSNAIPLFVCHRQAGR
ncbi:hypothetical protein T11_8746 [Trichinella zimbabwensis]|uniref:Uncharacterized protein n=1 Tax=Trichinella zimbabwensis TaxID=268475 RepID=A0A0V1HM29_9BILA|nr:hypothetical protein T11_8746 [Trichinella zimbabwensis]